MWKVIATALLWTLIFVFLAFSAHVKGRETMIGCYLIGINDVEDDRCKETGE